MQIDRVSLLLGFAMGLAVAAIVISGFVIASRRDGVAGVDAAAPSPIATSTQALVPSPTPTTTPTAVPIPTPLPTATPAPVPLRYETVDVRPRRFSILEIEAGARQMLEITVRVESDIDISLFDPSGALVEGPLRVQRSHIMQHASPTGGKWALRIDNSFSWVTTKQVLVQYRLVPQ
jgi:hypothetical protein